MIVLLDDGQDLRYKTLVGIVTWRIYCAGLTKHIQTMSCCSWNVSVTLLMALRYDP